MTSNDEYWKSHAEQVAALREYVETDEAWKQQIGYLRTSNITITEPEKTLELLTQSEAAEERFRRASRGI